MIAPTLDRHSTRRRYQSFKDSGNPAMWLRRTALFQAVIAFLILFRSSATFPGSFHKKLLVVSPPNQVVQIHGGGRLKRSKEEQEKSNGKTIKRNTIVEKATFAQIFFDLMPPHALPVAWLLYGFFQGDESRIDLLGYLVVSIIYFQLAKIVQGDSRCGFVGTSQFVYFMGELNVRKIV